MNKFKMILAALICVAAVAVQADTYTYTCSVTTGDVVTSAAVPVSGWLDRIEYSQHANGTSSVVVATYDGTTAVNTFMSLSSLTDTTKVVIPRVIGTDNTGTALTGAWAGGDTNLSAAATTVLVGAYERQMIGGNSKIVITGESVPAQDVKVVIYYEPLKK